MTSFSCKVPSKKIIFDVKNIKLIKNCTAISYKNNQLLAEFSDELDQAIQNKMAKQIRLLFSFCYKEVYPESYKVTDSKKSYTRTMASAHDLRKAHLLEKESFLEDKHRDICNNLFNDFLGLSLKNRDKTKLFNLLFVWSRANELRRIKLHREAYVQYWKILEAISKKENKGLFKNLLYELGVKQTRASNFSAKILQFMSTYGMPKDMSYLDFIAQLYNFRHPLAHAPTSKKEYYLEEEIELLGTSINNRYIEDATRIFIISIFGLKDYYYKNENGMSSLTKKTEST